MITFKQFLSEARMAPLYHGTYMENIESILKNDVLRANYTHDGINPKNPTERAQEVISLTRNIKTAAMWVGDLWGIVLELDQLKLSYNKKISPVEIEYLWASRKGRDYSQKSSGLYEEYVVGDIKPLSKYLKALIMSVEGYKRYKDKQEWTTQYDIALKHPLLKVDGKWVNK